MAEQRAKSPEELKRAAQAQFDEKLRELGRKIGRRGKDEKAQKEEESNAWLACIDVYCSNQLLRNFSASWLLAIGCMEAKYSMLVLFSMWAVLHG